MTLRDDEMTAEEFQAYNATGKLPSRLGGPSNERTEGFTRVHVEPKHPAHYTDTIPPAHRKLIELLDMDFPGYVTEYVFHPTRKWRFDYAWPDIKVAVEFDGLVSGAAHHSIQNILRDIEKINSATALGWRVLRIASPHLRDWDAAGQWIYDTITLAQGETNDQSTSD